MRVRTWKQDRMSQMPSLESRKCHVMLENSSTMTVMCADFHKLKNTFLGGKWKANLVKNTILNSRLHRVVPECRSLSALLSPGLLSSSSLSCLDTTFILVNSRQKALRLQESHPKEINDLFHGESLPCSLSATREQWKWDACKTELLSDWFQQEIDD